MSLRGRVGWALLGVTISFALLLPFDHFGKLELGRLVLFAIMLFIVVIRVCWDLRKRPLFWITIIAFAALHAPLIAYTAPRLNRMPFQALLGLADFDVALIILSTERALGQKTTLEAALSGRVDPDEGWLRTGRLREDRDSTEPRGE